MITIPKHIYAMLSSRFINTNNEWWAEVGDKTSPHHTYWDTEGGVAEQQRMKDTLAYIFEVEKSD